jgi:hypothetical protein
VQETKKEQYKMLTKATLRGFYFLCVFQILLGIFQVCLGIGLFGSPGDFMKNCYVVYGGLLILVGGCLLARLPAIYQVAAAFCGVEVVFGLVFVIASTMTIDKPALKYAVIVMGAIQMISAGFMFYFAEETATGSVSA